MTLDEAINKNIKMAELQERLLSNADDSLKEIVMKYATEYRQLAEWLRELKERRSGGWISCEERLPNHYEEVLVVSKLENIVYFAWYDADISMFMGHSHMWTTREVTHWIPLPKPPKDGDTNERH